jgi:hypothetical protein
LIERSGHQPVSRFHWMQLGTDLAIVLVTYLAALFLRFDGGVPDRYWTHFRWFIPVLIVFHLATNSCFGLYWDGLGLRQDVKRALQAGILTMLFAIATSWFVGGSVPPLPLSVLLLGGLVSAAGFALSRLAAHLRGAGWPKTDS